MSASLTAFLSKMEDELSSGANSPFLRKNCLLSDVVKAPTCPVKPLCCRVLLIVEERILSELPALFELPLFFAGNKLSRSSMS